MNSDIGRILSEWPYDQEHSIRITSADDGRSVLQVRLPMGIEQYELDGRPDGQRPFDRESVLAEYEHRREEYRRETGTCDGFELSHEDFVLLQEEGVLNYYRYVLLFQINDFERVERDTSHNLGICELVERFASSEDDKAALLQYRPYILRMNRMAKAMILVREGNKADAEDVLKKAIEEITDLPAMDSPAFQFEKIRSINYLKTGLKQLGADGENPTDELRRELEKAVDEENYERAAELRDQLDKLVR